jgi:hypothetical protein
MTTTEAPKKVIDLDTMEVVPPKPVAPEAKKEDVKEEEVEDNETKEEEKEPAEEVEEKEEDTEEEKETSEEVAATKKEEEKEEEEDKPVTIDDYLKGKYADMDIKSEEDLDGVLESMDVLIKRNEELEKELVTAKTGTDKPKFKSEAQEKLWDFVKDIDPARIGDRMQVYSRIVGMDVEKESPRLLLEEQFILDHPELPRDRALKKFNHEYNQKYGELNRDDFDSDAAFKDAKELREIDQEDDVHKAKKVIKAEQAKLKTETTTQTEDKPKENPVVAQSIKAITTELTDYVKDFSELIFSPTDKEEDDFHFKLSKDQVKTIHNAVQVWVKNPTSYDAKGNLIGGWKIEEQIKQTAYLLYGDDIIEQNYQHALKLKDITRAEEIATKKPDRKAKVAGDDVKMSMSEEAQWDMAIKKKKASAGNKSMVYK